MLLAQSSWMYLGSFVSLGLLWLVLGSVLFLVIRKVVRHEDGLGRDSGL